MGLKRKVRKLSEEHKRKISNSLKGRKGKIPSEESRKKMSESQKKITHPGRFKKGHKMSKEISKKISESRKGKYSGENSPRWKGGLKNYYQKKARELMIERGFNLEGLHVHHINHNIQDNRLENIKLLTPEEHGKIHGSPKGVKRSEKFKNNLRKIMKGNIRGFRKGSILGNKGIKPNYELKNEVFKREVV